MTDLFSGSAIISDCGRYRYRLDRSYAPAGRPFGPRLAVVMVNPSTADAGTDDATIRKVIGFARRHSFFRVTVGNLFAWRATDVRELRTAPDPVGPENDDHLRRICADAQAMLFAWGPTSKLPKELRDRWREVDALVRAAGHVPLCLGTAGDGHPFHPLMRPYDAPLLAWSAPGSRRPPRVTSPRSPRR